MKEPVSPKVRSLIDGLAFKTEGYASAKNILVIKYGNHNEVANAHVQNTMSLPHIINSNPYKIHECCETFLSIVQALETMGKLKGAVKLYFTHYSGMVIILFNTGLQKSAFCTDSFWNLVFCFVTLFCVVSN